MSSGSHFFRTDFILTTGQSKERRICHANTAVRTLDAVSGPGRRPARVCSASGSGRPDELVPCHSPRAGAGGRNRCPVCLGRKRMAAMGRFPRRSLHQAPETSGISGYFPLHRVRHHQSERACQCRKSRTSVGFLAAASGCARNSAESAGRSDPEHRQRRDSPLPRA